METATPAAADITAWTMDPNRVLAGFLTPALPHLDTLNLTASRTPDGGIQIINANNRQGYSYLTRLTPNTDTRTWHADVWLLNADDWDTANITFILTVQAATDTPDYTFTVNPRYDDIPHYFARICVDPAAEEVVSSALRTAQELIGYDYTKLLSDTLPNYRTLRVDLSPTLGDVFHIYGIWGQYYTRLRITQGEWMFFSIRHKDDVNSSDENMSTMRIRRNMLQSYFPENGPHIRIKDLPRLVTLPKPHPVLFPNGHLEAYPNGSLTPNEAEQLILFLTGAVNNPYVQEQMKDGLITIPEPYLRLRYHR